MYNERTVNRWLVLVYPHTHTDVRSEDVKTLWQRYGGQTTKAKKLGNVGCGWPWMAVYDCVGAASYCCDCSRLALDFQCKWISE